MRNPAAVERLKFVSALGIVEIFAWGSSFYLLAVLAAPIRDETGWSAGVVAAGISLGLLVSGLMAGRVGTLIQEEGGRRVMAAGMALLAVGLAVLGFAQTLPVYFAAWAIIGFGMAAGLYDAAFSTLGRFYGRNARGAITALTLWGGFASTVCWPITAYLVSILGWREACFAYAILHLTVTLPLCWFVFPRGRRVAEGSQVSSVAEGKTEPEFSALRFWCVALAGMMLAVLASIWSVHLITILTAQGHGFAFAVGLGALIGPAQVGARILEMLGRERHHPIWTMIASTSLVLLGFLGLLFDVSAAAALIAYGAGNGLWSIARGALPLALFGPRDYPRIMGRLARPMLIAGALSPIPGAFLIDRFGPDGTLLALTLGALVPCAAALVLWLDLAKARRAPSLGA
jgi:predicted MFS family arabinose efflux permease